MMKMCNPNMGMGMDIVHVVLNFHVCTDAYPEFLPYSNVHHLGGLLENPLPLLHLGHQIWVGYTLKVAAVGKQLGSAMVLSWKDCQL